MDRRKNRPKGIRKIITKERSFGFREPELLKQWDYEKNDIDPLTLTPTSRYEAHWRCDNGHEWVSQVYVRGQSKFQRKCPLCESFGGKHPELVLEWGQNNDFSPFQIPPQSNKKVHWECKKGHKWEARVAERHRRDYGCPYCGGKLATPETCLAAVNPELAAEWHPNNKFTPYEVLPFSMKKVWWRCKEDPRHEWESIINNRGSGRGCPFCTKLVSEESRLLFAYLAGKYPSLITEDHEDSYLLKPYGIYRHFDAGLIDEKIMMEYDGYFWHEGKENHDLRKVKVATNKGYRVIRIRQEPLGQITDLDVVVPHEFNPRTYGELVAKRLRELVQ